MKIIKISKYRVLVDDEDYEWLNDLTGWGVNSQKHVQLRKYNKGVNSTSSMARMIMFAPEDKVVDHIDGNPLNNQKHNLRLCTQQENTFNQKKSPSRFQYKGV